MTTANVAPGAGSSSRQSLRVRLPLLICSLIVGVLVAFLWIANREVETVLLQAAEARAQAAADQLASLLAQSAQQRIVELRRVAMSPEVRRALQERSDEDLKAAREKLAMLTSPSPQIVELWGAGAEPVLTLANPPTASGMLPAGSAPSASGVSVLQVSRNTVFSEVVTDVTVGPSHRIGFMVVRRPVTISGNSDVLNRLVGAADVVVGSKAGGVWTDLSKAVQPPPIDLSHPGIARYRAADGDLRLGALADIRGTPWSIWIAFPRSAVVSPARVFLRRMAIAGIIFVVVVALLVGAVSSRITTPLHDLTNASEAIASGEYSRRVASDRRDEIGRLGTAFNAMADRIEEVYRELESRVQQRTDELDRFFSLSLDLLCIAGLDGRFKRVSPAWTDVLGWTPAELMSAPYLDFVHPDDRAATAAESAKLAQGSLTLTFENRYRCKDGSYRWLSWKAARHPERAVLYAAARDVTDQQRAERELRQHAEELATVNRELEAFSYSVSHDLRAPLRHVTGFANLLGEQASASLGEEGHRYLKTIVDAATRMGKLIDDLLAFSRVGRAPLVPSRVNLTQLVLDCRQEVASDLNGRDVEWRLHDLPAVDGDPSLLRLVFVNLLSNALKYSSTRAHAEIEVGSITDHDRDAVVFVRDNGVGFDMTYSSKLFGVFERLHSSDEFEGTGIGLANVRRIVQRHGGRAWAEGTVDGGATFYVSLPTREDQVDHA
jgi:PAS domain S-box-containing protein